MKRLDTLARELQASRKLLADIRALHMTDGSREGPWCIECGEYHYPCPTIRLIEEAGL